VPLVSAAPLRTRTGVRALVGDRLTTVDVDSGAVRAAPRLPDHLWAFGVGVTGSGTYALLGECGTGVDGQRTEVARVLADGTLRAVSRGNYDQLLAGGNHPWAVVDDPLGDRSRVDPLDGGRTLALPTGFGALGGFGESLVGTVPGDDADTSFTIEVLDPRTGHVGVQLGPAVSVGMSHGVVLWTAPGCRTACRIYTYDLRSGQRATTVNPVPGVATVWSAVLSPDGDTVALVRERSDPGPYDPGHPGNPNELVTVDLRTGTLHQVPGLVLWSKSSPGVAFSPDSRWLVIGLDEGTDVRLLVWRPGLVGPLESPARLRYPVAYAPTVTALG
jgi:hypothetical protein